jgi:phenylpropionate dioxygenase-like ring-hydroxylating dioxygenase large terminal subunit
MYPDAFPRNQWYVGARSEEVGRELLSRRLLDTPVLFYRTEGGQPVALADRCPHRQLPLSRGRLLQDTVECGYHGLAFGTSGQCIRIPQQDHVPPRLRVDAYPLRERLGFVWIWLGDPARADETLIPDHHWMGRAGWASVTGTLHVKARAQLMNENLLDLSHLTFLHPGSLGTDKLAEFPVRTEWDERSVRGRRDMPGIESPALFVRAMGLAGMIDRTQVAEFFAPSFHVTHVAAKPAGDPTDARLAEHKAIHCLTPETRRSTHYFWAWARSYGTDDPEVSPMLLAAVPPVFRQDIDAVEAIEEVLQSYEPGHPPEFNIKVDAGPIQARRLVEQMVAAEQGDGQRSTNGHLVGHR